MHNPSTRRHGPGQGLLLWSAVLSFIPASALLGAGGRGAAADQNAWVEVVAGVLRSDGFPCGYALTDGKAALIIGAPRGLSVEALKRRGVDRCELVLLTHHHRDSCEQAGRLAAAGVAVRAGKK